MEGKPANQPNGSTTKRITPRGTCAACGRDYLTLPAKGLCWSCYDVLFPKDTRNKKKTKAIKAVIAREAFPKKVMMPIWMTSDEKEWGNEIDALRYQLDLERYQP